MLIFHKVKLHVGWELKCLVPDLKTCDVLSYLSLSLLTKSVFYLFLVLGIITSPIIVLPFPVVFTAAGEPLLVDFIPSSATGFHSLRILCRPSFLPG